MVKRPLLAFRWQQLLALVLGAGAWILVSASLLHADDVVLKKLVSGLGNPVSIAVRPEGGPHGEVFVCDSSGGRILRVALDRSDVAEEVITGFPRQSVSKEMSVTAGVESVYFLDHTRLVVSGGDAERPFIRLYELPELGTTLHFDDQKQIIAVAAENQHESSSADIRGFHSIIRPRANDHVSDMLLLAADINKPVSGIWKIPIRANTLEDAVPFPLKAKDEIQSVDAFAVATSGYVVVAVTKEGDGGAHTMLRFVDPIDGRSRMNVDTNLEAIRGIAYSPTTGDLFATGFESLEGRASGVFRLDDAGVAGKPACQAKKIVALPPSLALAFGPEGTLLVTCQEPGPGGDNDGALYRITGF